MVVSLSFALALTSLALAAPPRRAVLLGTADEPALGRLADELRAAAYEVLVVPSDGSFEDAKLAELAQEQAALAVVSFRARDGEAQVVICVVDRARGESTLRRLAQRPVGTTNVDQVMALRVVEVLNAALLELERDSETSAPPHGAVAARASSSPVRQAARAETRLGLAANLRGTWLGGGLPPFVGPQLGGRVGLSSGLFLGVSGFVSASEDTFRSVSGSAHVRIFEANLAVGFQAPLGRRAQLGVSLLGGWIGAWARAEPAVGYRERDARSLSFVIEANGEVSLQLSNHLSLPVALGVGLLWPQISVSQASTPVAVGGPWLGSASLGLAVEWEP